MARSGVLWPQSDSEGNSSKLLQFSNSGNLGYYTALEQLKVGQISNILTLNQDFSITFFKVNLSLRSTPLIST